MKILLTGGAGMVGKNILEHDMSTDHEFLSPSSSELNLLNSEDVQSYIKTHRPDFIIHAAGRVGGIQANIREPVRFLTENMNMGFNLVLAAQAFGVPRLLNLGSSCMYPRNAPNPLTEEMVLKGELEPTNEGYAIAKCAVSRLCDYVGKENQQLQYKTIIPCNLYGRWDKFDPKHSHLIPAVIVKILDAKNNNSPSVTIWGDGTARREFMYASDLADFISQAINQFDKLDTLTNVGLGKDYSIKEYYETIAKVIGFEGEFEYDLSKPTGMKQKLVNTARAEKAGWQHKISLEEGIQKTLNFYKEHCL